MRHALLFGLALAGLACAEAKGSKEEPMPIETKTVLYRHGDVELEGYVAVPAKLEGKRPGVVVVHAWMGLGEHERESADALARDGYAAFALDMYGKGVRAETAADAARLAGIYRGDRDLMRARAAAGVAWLRSRPNVDVTRIAAIGYCFGGGAVLELARSGADLAGVVSFHGNLDTPGPEDAKGIRGKVLVLTGAADPHVPMTAVEAFAKEMEEAHVDWQLVMYGAAVHSFTDPRAGSDPSRGSAYDEKAAARSWAAMRAFFAEVLR